MRVIFSALWIIIVFWAVPCAWADKQRLALAACYELALQQSESLKIDEEQIRAADARYQQVVSALYPGVEAAVSERLREEAGSGSGGSGGVNDSSRREPRTDRFQAGVRVTQLLFSGFRQYLLARAAESDRESQELSLKRSRELLYETVADVFYQIVLAAEDLKLLAVTDKTLADRVGELKERTKLGKARESEILSAEGDLYDIRAALEQTSGLQAAAKEALAFLIGIPAADFEVIDTAGDQALPPLDTFLAALEREKRADVRAAESQVRAQEQLVEATKRQYWPRIELEGNVYGYQSPEIDGNYDVTLRMAMPIFDGWRIQGQVLEQKSLLTARQLELKELLRKQEEEVRSAHARVDAARREERLIEKLLQVSEANLHSQRADYDLGIVNNLAVLDAIRQLTSTRRRFLVVRVSQRLQQARLKVAAGLVTSNDLS